MHIPRKQIIAGGRYFMNKLLASVLTLAVSLTAAAAYADTLTMATNASFPPY